jgi:hypothetical protein
MTGRCYVEIGDPQAVAPWLSAAITGYQTDHHREIALYRT